jgi:hypothetical protein
MILLLIGAVVGLALAYVGFAIWASRQILP